jgi:hypothetical protein
LNSGKRGLIFIDEELSSAISLNAFCLSETYLGRFVFSEIKPEEKKTIAIKEYTLKKEMNAILGL